jgi:hypothetical protein
VTIDAIDLAEKRISLIPADYVSPEAVQDKERTEYKSFITKEKKKKPATEMGSLGALLKAKMAEKDK